AEMSIIEEYERNQQFEQQYIVCRGLDGSDAYYLSHMSHNRNITPDVLQHLLESRVSEHMEDCLHKPVFSVAPNIDSSPNLLISCKGTV
ncbi:hypothetical protein GBF38_000932, partial [Nibea albiflora]